MSIAVMKEKADRSIAELMTRKVVSVSPDDALHACADLMRTRRISSIVVSVDGRPQGIVTERDILRALTQGTLLTTLVSHSWAIRW